MAIVLEEEPYRPERVEPCVRKRRPKNYSLMKKPRHNLEKLPPMEYYCPYFRAILRYHLK